MLCVLILAMSEGAYSLTLNSTKFLHFRVFARRLLRGMPEGYWEECASKNIFYVVFCSGIQTWDLKHGLSSNKPTQHLLDYGNFLILKLLISTDDIDVIEHIYRRHWCNRTLWHQNNLLGF